MKKLLTVFIVLLLVAGALGAVPYWFGMEAEKAHKRLFGDLIHSPDVTVGRRYYNRGWLSSTAATELRLADSKFRITITDRIQHGPFPLDDIVKHISSLTWIQAIVDSNIQIEIKSKKGKFEKLPQPITAHSSIAMNGQANIQVRLPAGQTQLSGGGEMKWKAGTGQARYAPTSGRINGTLGTPQVSIIDGRSEVLMDKLEVNFDLTRSRKGLTFGTSKFSVATIKIKNGEMSQGPISLSAVNVVSDTRDRRSLVDYSFNAELREVRVGKDRYGPGKIMFNLIGLDARALATKTRPSPGQASMSMSVGGIPIGDLLKAIGKNKTELNAQIEFTVPSGTIKGDAKLNLKPATGGQSSDMFSLLNTLNAKANLSVPEPIMIRILSMGVEQELGALRAEGKIPGLGAAQKNEIVATAVTERLQNWLGNRYVVLENQHYVSRANFENGGLTVNGSPIQLLPNMN